MKRKKSAIFEKKLKHKYIIGKDYRKIKYHCHFTDKYGVVANSICNLKISIPQKIPVVFTTDQTMIIILS